ncbi:MAG: DnaB-like helicase N-terminal domain-containing protein, partial [Megasphaera sp.]
NKYVAAHPETGQQQVVISPSVSEENAVARGRGSMAVAEENILRFLLEKPASCERIRSKVPADLFADERRRHIYQLILDTYAHQGMYTPHDIQQKLTPEEAEEVARIMVLQDVPMDENVLMDYVKRFRLADLQKQYLAHSRLAAAYSRNGDTRLGEELAACKKINDEMKQWS